MERINSAHAPHRHRLPTPCSPPVSSLTMPPLLTQDGKTPLQLAEQKGYTAIVKAFEDVKAAGGANNFKMLYAAKKDDLTQLNAAIEAGADVEAKDPVRGINRQRAPHCHRRFTQWTMFPPRLLSQVTSHNNRTCPSSPRVNHHLSPTSGWQGPPPRLRNARGRRVSPRS